MTIEPKVPLRRLLRVRGFGGMQGSVRVGAAVVAADALRAGAGDPTCLGQCDMALRAAVGALGAALGGHMSDCCTSQFGHWRSFILTGAVLIAVSVLIIGDSADIEWLIQA
jgi:hypothetical protein